MANMSYCRFENTYSDFSDCVNALQNEGLEGLSDSESQYATNLYELAKTYVAIYEMEKESEDSEEYSIDDEKSDFLAYYRVQMKGDYNMITERVQAAKAAGLSLETYDYVQSNYNTLLSMFDEDCKLIDKELFNQLIQNESK